MVYEYPQALEDAESKIKEVILDLDILTKKLNLEDKKNVKTKPGS